MKTDQSADIWHESFKPASLPKVHVPESAQEIQRAQESINEARRMLCEKQRLEHDKEAVRAAHWSGLPINIRRGCMVAANLPKERADDALCKFDAIQRGLIWMHITQTIRSLEIAKLCMQGGHISSGEAVH